MNNSQTTTIYLEIEELDYKEFEILVTFSMSDSGIGQYEYWGATYYDDGYGSVEVEIDDIEVVGDMNDSQKDEIVQIIDKSYIDSIYNSIYDLDLCVDEY